MSIYREHVLDHYKHPRNHGSLESPDYTMTAGNESCGDETTVYFKVNNGVIVEAKHFTTGCAVSQAAASMLFERLEGMRVDEVLQVSKEEIFSDFGAELSTSRVKCALLALHATKKAFLQREPTDLVMDTAGARDEENQKIDKERT
jgi:nitrogen fixation protein NifU and related proteins